MSTLFVSDLHLDAAMPAAGAQFIEFLQARAGACDALYVLGDLFESWIGDDDREPHREAVCTALARLSEHGVPCYVMRGNRDFLLGAGFAARSGAQLLADPTVIDLYGEPVLITHGDALCTADRAYQRLRAQLRRERWQRRFLRLPLATRRALAERARAGSARYTRAAAHQIMDVDPASVQAAMRACAVRTLIHGHTHRPAVHEFELAGAPSRRIVLGAWYEQGSCLSWDAHGFALETLPRVSEAP